MKDRVTVGLACRIAGIDRDRFNEAVHAGNYPCAPGTARGATRVFSLDDLVSLYVYVRLLEEEMPSKAAGRLACSIGTHPRMYPGDTRIHVGRPESGTQWILPGSQANDTATNLLGRQNEIELLISV